MTSNNKNRSTPREALAVVFRHKKKIIFSFCAIMSVVVAAIVLWPRTYISEAKVFVRVGRESVALDPTATMGEVIPVSPSREVEINSVLEVFRSRFVAEKVVASLGPGTILGKPGKPNPARVAVARMIPRLDPISDYERAVNQLEEHLNISAKRKTNIISVTYKAETPELAQTIVAKLLDVYLSEHARLNRTPGSHGFFAEQTALLQRELTKAVEKLRDAKNEMGLVSIASQQEILQGEIITIETDLVRARAAQAASQGKADGLREAVGRLPEKGMADEVSGLPNVAADEMRRQLYDLELREAELASKFNDDYPLLVSTRRQVEYARKILDQQQPRRTQWTTTINPNRQQLQLNLLGEESNIKSRRAEVQSLRGQYAHVNDRLKLLNNQEVHIGQLQRKTDLLAANYKDYAEKLEQSRIDKALESERITNVNVVQPASYIGKPVSPKKLMILILGLVSATLVALGVALTAEILDSRLKTPAEVETKLALPVLLSIPRIARRHVMLKPLRK